MDGLVDYYASIAEASGLGVLVYSRDWAHFTPAQAEQLAEIPNIVAWKDGSADIRRYQMIRERLGDKLHWVVGLETIWFRLTTELEFVPTLLVFQLLLRNCPSNFMI